MELPDFLEHAVPLVQAAKLAPAQANPCHRADIAVFSCLPWIPFTQVASAYRVFRDQYFPLIHWGKVEEDVSGRMVMPVAIQANHVLVDGVHVGRFTAFWKNCAEINSVKGFPVRSIICEQTGKETKSDSPDSSGLSAPEIFPPAPVPGP